jgi:Fur family ferric uptake transcriptional regulator
LPAQLLPGRKIVYDVGDLLIAKICKSRDLRMVSRTKITKDMRDRGIRVTAQRTLILETLAAMTGHPSAQQVYEEAEGRLPGLNLATVYRNLYHLHEAGLVDLMSTGPGVQRFAYRDPENLHAHLVCQQCQRVQEIPPEVFDPLAQTIRRRFNFYVDTRHLALSGLCRDCARGQEG